MLLAKKITAIFTAQSEMKKNLFTLGIGTAIAQIVPLLFYPVLSRLYAPAEFGLLATILSVVTVIAVVANGKYEKAIIIAKDENETNQLFFLSISLGFVVCLLSFFGLLLFGNQVSSALQEPQLIKWILICPWVAFMLIIYNSYNEWCVKKGLFFGLSVNKNINSFSIVLAKLFLGIANIKWGLIFGEILGRTISAFSCLFFMRKKIALSSFQINSLKSLAKKYIDFPKFTLPDQLLSTLGISLPVFFISRYFGNVELGYFAMMYNILAIPSVFLGHAIMDVFRKRASVDFERDANCKYIYAKTFKATALLAFFGLVLTVWFLPLLFAFVLGEEWRQAGVYAQIMAPAIAISFVYNSLSSLWIIAKKLKYQLYWQIFYVTNILAAMYIGGKILGNINSTIILLSSGLSIAYIVNLLCTWNFAKGNNAVNQIDKN